MGKLVVWLAAASACLTAQDLRKVDVQQAPGQAPLEHVEVLGVGPGKFDPALWQSGRLNWAPDVRVPFLAPRQGGLFRNIYAPSIVQEPYGWRLFYGAWDGVSTGNDRIYSVTTRDFIDFDEHRTVIEHGGFIHVCNVNVQKIDDGSYHMICTAYPDTNQQNKPIYFASPDGNTWNGTPEPHVAALSELVDIRDYAQYAAGDLNGANVLLRDNGRWLLYFNNWKDPGKVYWAQSGDPKVFRLRGVAVQATLAVNDVKKFTVAGQNWYLMGLHMNRDMLYYSLSNDGLRFPPPRILFTNLYPDDRYIVAIGFVTMDDTLLGVIYGAGAVPSLDRNRLFARWLQKKVVLVDQEGTETPAAGSLGPDRLRIKLPAGKPFDGTLKVFAEDGLTALASVPVRLEPGRVYQLSWSDNLGRVIRRPAPPGRRR
jgi:hypothetical protein